MTNTQTNQIETLSDAELDNVAGGFSLAFLKNEVKLFASAVRHPIDNAGFFVGEAKGAARAIFSIF